MKKLLLIIIGTVLIGLISPAQGLWVNNTKTTTYKTYTMDGDSAYMTPTRKGYLVSAQLVWSSLDALDGSAKWQACNDGVNYLDFINLDSIILDVTTGSKAIMIPDWHVDNFAYHRLYINSGACTSGTLKVYIRINSDR